MRTLKVYHLTPLRAQTDTHLPIRFGIFGNYWNSCEIGRGCRAQGTLEFPRVTQLGRPVPPTAPVPDFLTWKARILKYCGYSIANRLCHEYCRTYLLGVFTTHPKLSILTL